MNKFRFTIRLLAIATFMFAFTSMAQAQATRTWVSGVGDDANPCSRTAPCKTFAGAISKTADCGEIDALDPGGFGAVTITKSITIDGTGTLAGVLASLTTGIIVNAPVDKVVTIRGLSINGACNGIRGMNILSAKEVNVEDCVIFRFANEGILVSTTATMQVNVRNTVIRDNVGAGISVTNTAANIVKGSLVNSSFIGNGVGLLAKKGSRIHADQCNFSGSTGNGVTADGVGGVGVADVTNSLISNNASSGIAATNGGIGRINNCDIFANTGTGALVGAGSEIDTWGNNRIFSNAVDLCPGCTPKAVS